MELPAPCGGWPQDNWDNRVPTRTLAEERVGLRRGSPGRRRGRGAGGRLYLLVEGDVVQPHAQLPREEVGAVVAVTQEAPAQRRARPGAEGVRGAAQAQRRAGSPQTLGAGVVVVQEAWAGGNSGVHTPAPEGPLPPLLHSQDP